MKCCYCESKEQSKRNDVEHYRPAGRAVRSPGSAATHGYWWLAFTWENLLFSCRNCNQSPAKLDKFPLDTGSEALIAEQAPPGKEKPLLIDPGVETGVDAIEFVPVSRPTGTQWMPRARAGNTRGDHSVRVCMLDRPDLLTLYADHLALNVTPDVDAFVALLPGAPAASIVAAWHRLCARHLNAAQVFVGLVRDYIAHRVPIGVRQTYGLQLPAL